MIYDFYSEKIKKVKKNEIEDLMLFFMKMLNGTSEIDKIRDNVLLDLTKKLFELDKKELVTSVIKDFDKLNELVIKFEEEKDFLIYIYISSLVKNGLYKDVLKNLDYFEKNNHKKSEFYEKNLFNLSLSCRKEKQFEKCIIFLEGLEDVSSKLELAYVYSQINDKTELSIYNQLLKQKITLDEKACIYLRYANYFSKINNSKECSKYVNKLINIINQTCKNYRSALYYELAILLKYLNREVDSIFFLQLSSRSKIFGEIQFEYKLKAIILLLEKKCITEEEASSLIRLEDNFQESELIKKYKNKILGGKK